MITHRLSRYTNGQLDGDVECTAPVDGETWTSRDRIKWVSRDSGRVLPTPRTDAALERRVAYCGSCGHRIDLGTSRISTSTRDSNPEP